jgi:hypothetical protein
MGHSAARRTGHAPLGGYSMNPNSQHQLWSRWEFDIDEVGRHVPRKDFEYNAARWIRAGFGTAGEIRVRQTIEGWRIEVLVEGVPAHDPWYVASVRQQFRQRFVAQGWGPMAIGRVSVKVLAGDVQDGRPRAQLLTLPPLQVQ